VKQPGHADPVMQIQQLEPARARAGHAARLKWALGYLQKKDWWVIRRPESAPDSAPEDEAPERPKKDKRGTKNKVADLILEGKELARIVVENPDLRGFISTNVRQLREFEDMMAAYYRKTDPIWPAQYTLKYRATEKLLYDVATESWQQSLEEWGLKSAEWLRENSLPTRLKLFGREYADGNLRIKNWWLYKIVRWILHNFCCPRNRETQKHLMIWSRTGHGKSALFESLGRFTTVYKWCYENGTYQTAPDDTQMIIFDEFLCNLPIGMVNSICDASFQINGKNKTPKKMAFPIPCVILTNIELQDHYSKLVQGMVERGGEGKELFAAYARRWEYVEIPGKAHGLSLKTLTNVLYHLASGLLEGQPIAKKHHLELELSPQDKPIAQKYVDAINEIKNM